MSQGQFETMFMQQNTEAYLDGKLNSSLVLLNKTSWHGLCWSAVVFDKLPPQILLLVISRMLTQSFTEVAIKKHLALD